MEALRSEPDYEKTADDFLELASHKRLEILFKLLEKESKISEMVEKLGVTKQEVSRNFDRLVKASLISKDHDGYYNLTTYGKTVLMQVPTQNFLTNNKEYFREHDFGDIPQKFIQRIGQLANCQHVESFTRVFECWNEIFSNANEYIYGIVYEEPLEIIEPIVRRARDGVKIKSIFSEAAIIPKKRKDFLEKLGFKTLIEEKVVERKMQKKVKTIVLLNEKEGCVMFPTIKGKPDISRMFYSNDSQFQEWCLDYFRYCWYDSSIFQERKLKV